MFSLAWKNLWQEKGRFFISVGTVAAVVFLVLTLQGILNGMIMGTTSYIDHLTAEIVVMQDGVSNMHMASSFIPASMISQISGMQEVKKAKGFLYIPGLITLPNNKKVFGYLSGIEPKDADVGPWDIVMGRSVVRGNEVVMDQSILHIYKLKIGDQIEYLDKKLTIVGMARDTGPLINPIIFIPKDKLASLTKTRGLVSYILVWPGEGADRRTLISKITDRFGEDDVNVMTKSELSRSDQVMIRKMSADLVQMIVVVTLLAGLVVVVLMLYTLTLSKIRDYGIMKAIGGSNSQLMMTALWQGLILSLIGLSVGIALALGVFPVIEALSPGIGAFLTLSDIFSALIAIVVVGASAAILPIFKIKGVDPLLVFKA